MSERRQLALLLAGVVALVAIGIGGATLFPERCADLEQLGELELSFVDAADALPVSAEDGAAIHGTGEQAGLGPWRGAVALPDGARVLPSEFGFFVVTDDDFTVLRPSIGIASAARGRAGLDVLPAGSSIALRAADGETGVYNGEYELDRCGQLPTDGDVLSIDAGFAVVVDGTSTRLVTLSGDEVWTRDEPATQAHVSTDGVLLYTSSLQLLDTATGDVLDEVPEARPPGWWWADDQLVVVQDGSGPRPVDVTDGGLAPREQTAPPVDQTEPLHGVVPTGAGLLALSTTTVEGGEAAVLTRGDGQRVVLPAGVLPEDITRSADGHVGITVVVEGSRALLVFGPAAT